MSDALLLNVELTIDEVLLARNALRAFAANPESRRVPDAREAKALADRLGAIVAGSSGQR